MAYTVRELISELEALRATGHGQKIVKFVGSCENCGGECDEVIDGAEPGDDQFPDEVWIS